MLSVVRPEALFTRGTLRVGDLPFATIRPSFQERMSNMSNTGTDAASPRPPISDKAKVTLGVAGGLLCLVMIVWGLVKPSNTEPEVTRAQYKAALQKWKDSGVNSYDLKLTISGRGDQNSEAILEVRNGRVTKSLYNGKPVSPKEEARWTVENQFKLIDDDLTKSEGPGFGVDVKKGVYITLHADFDPKYGYPDRYFRQAHGPSPLQSQWKVLDFKAVEADK
jgi:hypothetical protein